MWVFGMVDTTHRPALGYMEIVQRRNAATLLPIVQAHVLPGTVVWSDQWAAYNSMAALPAVAGHQTVNHSLHFKDPVTGVHINTIESYWNRYIQSVMLKLSLSAIICDIYDSKIIYIYIW